MDEYAKENKGTFLYGRLPIYTTIDGFNPEEPERIIEEVNEALSIHVQKLIAMEYLYWYRRGITPIYAKTKEIRENINNKISENLAGAICDFKNGFFLTSPAFYTSRKEDPEINEKVKKLNDYLYVSGKQQADNELVDWFHTVGKADLFVKSVDDDDMPFEAYALDPRSAFVVHSMEPGNKVVYAVHVVTNDDTLMLDVWDKNNVYKLYGTVTGRLASRNPNIQNLPKALKICGKKIGLKEVIQAPEGHVFSDMDLSSAEVKVLTVVCPDEKLVDVLKRGLDAHSYTASLVSQTSPNPKSYEEIYHSHQKADHVIDEPMTEEDNVNEALRKNAKRVTFGAIYRIGKQGLATQLVYKYDNNPALSFKENQLERQKVGEVIAQELLDKLFNEVYPTLGKSFARSDFNVFNRHYGESIFGRRRRYDHSIIPLVNDIFLSSGLYSQEGTSIMNLNDCISFVPSQRCFRQNVNFEVQSPTSDYMQFYINYILTNCADIPDFNFHLTVHDSALFSFVDTPENYAKFKKVCDYGMDVYLKSLDDRLPVTIGYGMDTAHNYCKIGG